MLKNLSNRGRVRGIVTERGEMRKKICIETRIEKGMGRGKPRREMGKKAR